MHRYNQRLLEEYSKNQYTGYNHNCNADIWRIFSPLFEKHSFNFFAKVKNRDSVILIKFLIFIQFDTYKNNSYKKKCVVILQRFAIFMAFQLPDSYKKFLKKEVCSPGRTCSLSKSVKKIPEIFSLSSERGVISLAKLN